MARSTTLATRATLLAAVVGVLALTLAYPLRLYLRQQEEIAELTASNAGASERVNALADELARYDDPEWVADEARRRLHYLAPGELAYLQPGTALPTPTSSPTPAGAGPDTAWYGQLWSQVTGAAAATPPSTPTPSP